MILYVDPEDAYLVMASVASKLDSLGWSSSLYPLLAAFIEIVM